MNTDLNNPIGFDAEAGYRRFLSRIQNEKSYPVHRFRRKIIRLYIPQVAAAVVIFMLGIFSYHYYSQFQSPEVAYYETIVPLGAKSQIVLTDGTKIWLNAGSRLRYPTTYSVSNRNVFLEGEAFFEVATNKSLPFEVKTSMLNVKATGTAFNVKAYPGDSIIETILVEGTVEVSRMQNNAGDEPAVSLQPKQRLTLLKNTNEILLESKPVNGMAQESKPDLQKEMLKHIPQAKEVPATTNYMIATSWKDKRWLIEGEELGSLAVKLERRYNVKISFADNSLRYFRFTGTLEDDPIESVLKAMAQVAPVEYEFTGSEFVLSTNEKFQKQYKKLWQKE
ncbi:MAG: FecR family protein [Candidatus Symbiothrix sp.]|jgi:ferric-dicitrate binding protein FerR (iron transport regulator)|nr:FecR family protein [Candidatus Symbiothrix sp.]